jgi:uncharacterized protein YndB with AHSA1/START domain
MSDLGDLEQLPDGGWRLRFRRALPYPRAVVWEAVSEPVQLARWFPTTIDGERRTGASLRFRFPDAEGVEPFGGEMIEFRAPDCLEFSWGPDRIRIELRELPGGTELTLLDTLEDVGKGARDGAGWHTCLDALAAALAGDPAARERLGEWREVHTRYRLRFGPEASTIGPPAEMAGPEDRGTR